MGRIIPAVLAPTPSELAAQAGRVALLSDLISYDITEAAFVGTSTPEPSEYPKLPPEQSIVWHLMAHEPAKYLADCLAFPTHGMVVHVEAHGAKEVLDELRMSEVLAGLALNAETPLKAIEPFLDSVDFVQLMLVKPGGQGRPFEPTVLAKIPQLRALRENMVVAVDGGVSVATIGAIASYRPDYVFVGSALTRAEEPADAYAILDRLLRVSVTK